jgi:hypothetical protein
MKNLAPLFLIVAVMLILILGYLFILEPSHEQKTWKVTDCTVKNLQVGDVEYDDGTALRLSWTPLPKEKRIISYRIYRGISPDSLFYVGDIPVNPKTGVASDSMFYYDKGFTPFVDISSPAKLKKERHQPPDSPLYRDMPKDLAVTGQYLNHYIILGVIPTKEFYYKTSMVTRKEQNSEGKMEDSNYAGLKIRQLRMLKELVPDHPYYYTVVAVDKAGNYFPYPAPVVGAPRDNRPEPPVGFYPQFVQDSPRLQFEYTIPAENGDINKYGVYALTEDALPAFDAFRNYLAETEKATIAEKEYLTTVRLALDKIKIAGTDSTRKAVAIWRDHINSLSPADVPNSVSRLIATLPDSAAVKTAFTQAVFPPVWTPPAPIAPVPNPARMVAERTAVLPYTTVNFMITPMSGDSLSLRLTDPVRASDVKIDTTLALSKTELARTYFVMGFTDLVGMQSFGAPQKIPTAANGQYLTKADLPTLPKFNVTDMINDKGDANTVSWGVPSVFITKAAFLDDAHTRLRVNYQVEKNKNFKIKAIHFDVMDKQGQKVTRCNEYFQDNVIRINSKAALDKGLHFVITLDLKQVAGSKIDGFDPASYQIEQELVFSDVSRALEPEDIVINGQVTTQFSFSMFKQPLDGTKYRFIRKAGGFSREMNDGSPFETSIFKQINQYDAKKQLVLASTDLAVSYNRKLNGATRTFVYRQDEDKFIADLKKEIDKDKKQIDSLGAGNPAAAMIQPRLTYYQTQYDLMTKDSLLTASRKIADNHARMKYIVHQREIDKRSWRYIMVRSDGKGRFEMSEPYRENGKEYFLPIPNWYERSKTPMLLATILFTLLVAVTIRRARLGVNLYIRPISGLSEIDNAIGRATEMGRPILYVPGLSGITDVATLAGLGILGKVARKAAEYDTRILVPCRDLLVLPIAQEIVREAHFEAGRPDSYDSRSAFYITSQQFAFVAGVNGVMIREKTAANFYMGMFWAEALIMTETGSSTGAIQIAGTDAVTQIPFFITTCDYTLIGEELYAASAYLSREPLMLGTLKAQDYYKFLIILFVIAGTILSTAHLTFLINAFPDK